MSAVIAAAHGLRARTVVRPSDREAEEAAPKESQLSEATRHTRREAKSAPQTLWPELLNARLTSPASDVGRTCVIPKEDLLNYHFKVFGNKMKKNKEVLHLCQHHLCQERSVQYDL